MQEFDKIEVIISAGIILTVKYKTRQRPTSRMKAHSLLLKSLSFKLISEEGFNVTQTLL